MSSAKVFRSRNQRAVVSPVLVLLLVALAGWTALAGNALDLKSLCADKSVGLTRISQIKSLADQLDSGAASACSERVQGALKDLNEMIGAVNGDVCTLEAAEKIRHYYETHVSEIESKNTKTEEPLPRALRNFVVGFGLRVSQLCKKNMINSLMIDSQALLTEEDHKLIAPWTGDQSLISQLMSEPSDYDDLLLPRDLNRVMEDARGETDQAAEGGEQQTDSKMYIQTATGQVIRKMQAICQRRFRPIYEQLILPLIFLSNVGFNYQGEELERELKEMSLNKEIHQWYRIVYLCEPLQDLEIVEDLRDAEKTQGTDERLVRILSHEEAAKIKAEFEGSAQDAAEEIKLGGIKQIVYKQEYRMQVEDEVLDTSDAGLMKLVNKFATHKSELQRIRSKLMKKLAKFMTNKLKHGQFNIIGSLMGGSKSSRGDESGEHEVHSANSEIVRAMDEYVEQASSPGEGAVSGPGLGGIAKRYYHKASTDGVSGLGGRAAKTAFNKANMKWYFWYFVAVCLFITGVVSLFLG